MHGKAIQRRTTTIYAHSIRSKCYGLCTECVCVRINPFVISIIWKTLTKFNDHTRVGKKGTKNRRINKWEYIAGYTLRSQFCCQIFF